MKIMRYIMLLTFIFILSGCSLSGNGSSSSRAKTKLANSLYKKYHPNRFNIFKNDIKIGDTMEICKEIQEFCPNKHNFRFYGNPQSDGSKNDNFYCICLY